MKISAEIDGRIADIKYIGSNGRPVAKSVPVDALCKILSAEIRGEKEFVVFPTGMRFHARMGNRVLVGFEEPESIRKITYLGPRDGSGNRVSNNWNVRMPSSITMVAFVEQDPGNVLVFNRFYQFATKAPFFGLDTPLFMWPFSNVYDDGSCCLGSVRIPNYSSLKDTVGAVNLFHLGTYNGDLSSHRINTYTIPGETTSITDPYNLWRHLQDDTNPKPFPYTVLKSVATLRTILSRIGFEAVL